MLKPTLAILAVLATAPAFAQTVASGNTVKAVNGPLLLQGVNSSGVATQSVSISNVGHIDARSANFNGADGVSAQKVTAGVIATTGNKIYLNGANGNLSVNGVALLHGGAYVGPRVEGGSLPALTVNGQTATKGIHNGGQKIAGVANGNVNATSDQAVNGSQLHAEVTSRTDADAALSARIEAEAVAREEADKANASTSAAQVAASEARSVKASYQSGALAMAVAGMTGASPTDHGRTAISMGVGTFGGETALAVGVSHAVNDAVRIFGSVTKVSGGDTGAAIGGSYSF